MLMLPPTYLTCLEVAQLRRARRGAGRGAGRDGRDVHARHRGARRRLDAVDPRPPAAGPGRAARLMAAPWAGGSFGDAGALRAGAQRRHDDARRHQHLGAARARRREVVVVDPGPSRTATSTLSPSSPATSAWCCSPTTTSTTPRPRGSSPTRMGCPVRALTRLHAWRRTRSPTTRSSRSTGSSCRWSPPPATPRTRCRSCCRPRGRAHRRHGARPRHDGRRPARRRARRLLRLPRPAARPRRRRRGRHHLARPRPGDRRRARRAGLLPRPPSGAARAGRGRARASWAPPHPDADDEELPRRVVEIVYQDVDESSGAPPSGRSAPSSPTSPPLNRDFRSVESGLSCRVRTSVP